MRLEAVTKFVLEHRLMGRVSVTEVERLPECAIKLLTSAVQQATDEWGDHGGWVSPKP